jgi:hypothetical protein
MMDPQLAAAVLLPYVGHWREMTDPLAEAALLSERPADELPKPLRAYGRVLASLAELVLRSGLLGDPGIAAAHVWAAQSIRSTGGMRAVGAQSTGSHAIVAQPRSTQTGGTRAVGNSPATTSGDFLSVPLSRFAAYGGAR